MLSTRIAVNPCRDFVWQRWPLPLTDSGLVIARDKGAVCIGYRTDSLPAVQWMVNPEAALSQQERASEALFVCHVVDGARYQ